jgi:hypothetical protein
MRQVKPLLWITTLAGVWLLTSFDTVSDRYREWIPYFMKRAELEKSVFVDTGTREMVNPGKIWIAGDSIYVVERYKGVHVIDNTDPANPRQAGFLVAPGCMDVAVKGGVLYLDNAVDLVSFDLARRAETSRLKNYFPEPVSPAGDRYNRGGSEMILVGWKQSTINDEEERRR